MRAWVTVGIAIFVGSAAPAGCASTQPVGEQWDDVQLSRRIDRELMSDELVDSMDVDVDAVDRVVYLHGETETEAEKERAEQIARQTPGVEDVVNQLSVTHGETELFDGDFDTWITTKTKSRLAIDLEVNARNVDVDTSDGVVTLTGIVETEEAREKAAAIARSIQGVDRVVNNLRIES